MRLPTTVSTGNIITRRNEIELHELNIYTIQSVTCMIDGQEGTPYMLCWTSVLRSQQRNMPRITGE
jgi:hypothetical protein